MFKCWNINDIFVGLLSCCCCCSRMPYGGAHGNRLLNKLDNEIRNEMNWIEMKISVYQYLFGQSSGKFHLSIRHIPIDISTQHIRKKFQSSIYPLQIHIEIWIHKEPFFGEGIEREKPRKKDRKRKTIRKETHIHIHTHAKHGKNKK